jgi:hypothetical protein
LCSGDYIKDNETGRERGTCGGEDGYRQRFGCETGKKVDRLRQLRDSETIILKWILKEEV